MRISPDGNAEGPGQAEVGQLDVSAVVDEQVLWLQIPVEYSVNVTVGDALQQLIHVALKAKGRGENFVTFEKYCKIK